MTASFTTHPSTADLLLNADPSQVVEELARAVDVGRVVDELSRRVQAPPGDLVRKAAMASGELLQGIDLGTVLLNGWSTYRALRAAARRTLDNPGTGQMVPLLEHEIVSHHDPYVEVQVNGQPVHRLTLGVDLKLKLALVQASIRNGRLMRLTAGTCTASLACSMQGIELAGRDLVQVELPINRDLGEGIPLLRDARTAH
ncbi:hypothetical protein ACIBHX_30740 [Nonomuraea sp. NPDC050536]|uniref:hypothetical protein n=1 Tax=Nonomuraea sp. NPDC050536 TaxID=3364366 RepID=UPI0037C8FE9B